MPPRTPNPKSGGRKSGGTTPGGEKSTCAICFSPFEGRKKAKVAERAAKEEALTKERKDKAERDLDTFYDQNTDKKAQKQASNRDHDDELKAMLERPVPANPFEKVVELIGGAQADVDNEDTSIMRRLLVRLKNDPKRSNDVDMDALGSS